MDPSISKKKLAKELGVLYIEIEISSDSQSYVIKQIFCKLKYVRKVSSRSIELLDQNNYSTVFIYYSIRGRKKLTPRDKKDNALFGLEFEKFFEK